MGSERIQPETDQCLAREFVTSGRSCQEIVETRSLIGLKPSENSSTSGQERAAVQTEKEQQTRRRLEYPSCHKLETDRPQLRVTPSMGAPASLRADSPDCSPGAVRWLKAYVPPTGSATVTES